MTKPGERKGVLRDGPHGGLAGRFGKLRSELGLERNVFVLGISSMVATFANAMWIFFLPLLLQDQGLTAFHVGAIYGLSMLLVSLIQVPAGAFVDKCGRKTSVVLASLVGSSSVLLLAVVPGPILFTLAYLMNPVARTLFSIGMTALIMESASRDRLATSFGTFRTLAGCVTVIAPALGGFLIQTQRTREVLFASSLLLFIVFLVRAIFIKETSKKAATQPIRDRQASRLKAFRAQLRLALTDRSLLTLALVYGVYNMILFSQSFIIPLYSKAYLGLSSVEIGLMFTLFVVFDALLGIPFGMMADRVGRIQTILISWLGEMIAMMVFAYSTSPIMAFVSFSAWVAFGSMDAPALQALLGDITKTDRRGLSLGFFNTFALIFSIPSPLITGALYSVSGKMPFFANLLIDLLAFALFLYFLRVRWGAETNPPVQAYGVSSSLR